MTVALPLLSILTLLNGAFTFANWQLTRQDHSDTRDAQLVDNGRIDELNLRLRTLEEGQLRMAQEQARFSASINNVHSRIDMSLEALMKRLERGY